MRAQALHKTIKISTSFGSPLIGRSYEADTSNGYRFGFNGKENDNQTYGDGNAMDFGARIMDTRLGRWLSLDPLQAKYPNLSPYSAFANSPILVIDKDGYENIIYLIVLPDANTVLSKTDIQNTVDKANASFAAMGLNTRVEIWTPEKGEEFNMQYLDPSDGVAVIGSKNAVMKEIKRLDPTEGTAMDESFKNDANCPEESSNISKPGRNGKFIAISAGDAKGFAKLTHSKVSTAIAFLIMHGRGHNAGAGNNHDATDAEVMTEGGNIIGRIEGGYVKTSSGVRFFEKSKIYTRLEVYMTKSLNSGYIEKIKEIFGNKASSDNYKANKADSKKTPSFDSHIEGKPKN